MKTITLALAMLLTGTAAQANPWEISFPSLEEQWESAQLSKLDELILEAETDPNYAGTLFEVQWKGQLYKVVDRRGEPGKKAPGTPPARSTAMASLLNGLSSEARAQVQVRLNVIYNKDGSIASENWVLDFAASWQSQSGKSEADGKQHK